MGKSLICFAVCCLAVVFAPPAFSDQPDCVHLNEIFASHSGTDNLEFIELIGKPGQSLDSLMVLIVEGDSTNAGTLDRAWDLTGFVMPTDGYFVLGDTAVPNVDLDIGSDNNIENGTETFYLIDAFSSAGVANVTALLGTNLDPEGDLITVLPSTVRILEMIAMVDSGYPANDKVYDGAEIRGPDGTFFPAGILRNMDYGNDWGYLYLDFDPGVNTDLPTTPGEPNSFSPFLNEIYASHSGTDNLEFIELISTPDINLDYLMVLIVEGEGPSQGILDRAWPLTTYTMPSDGYFVLGDTAVANVDLDIGGDNRIENGTETFYLVDAFDQDGVDAIELLLGTDVDADKNGVTDIPGLAQILDIIAMVNDDWPIDDRVYDGADTRGPDGSFFPAGIFRNGDFPAGWIPMYLDFDPAGTFLPDTPGTQNVVGISEADLGLAGPGSAEFWIYGDDLATGSFPDLLLTNAAPGQMAYLVAGAFFSPIWIDGGCLVPFPWSVLIPIPVDAYGNISIEGIVGGGGPATIYAQFVIFDPTQPKGYDFSNALELDILP